MKIKISLYLRAKYFEIYSLKFFAGQKKSLIRPNLAGVPPYAYPSPRSSKGLE
jgi:hypothetical protein